MQCFVLAAACTQFPASAFAGGPAPGVRIPLTALPSGIATQPQVGTIGGRPIFAPQVVAGTFNPYQVAANANGSVTGTITQTNNAGILQWGSFDIGANATVNVVQPSSTAVLLNKVSGGSFNNSTLIEGALNANGQVYVYNPNGIIFGKTSQINVNTLVATTLKIDDSRFLAGILVPTNPPLPIFAAGVAAPGAVQVEGERDASGNLVQAQITAASGGRILLAAPSVTNNGVLTAPDGQVVLAAGGKVFVASPSDVRMRGLVVEVSNDNLAAAGAATNDTLGRILVGRGNATMVGLAVNQMGLVSATTSVAANGSIYLHARDGSTITAATPLTASHGGALVLGSGSVTEVLPDLTDTTTSTGAGFNASVVDLAGKTIHLQQNAAVVAPGGNVTASAFALAEQGASVSPGGNSHIYLDSGAVIDVSGTTGTQLAMESNVIQVQLRGTELADSPLQRNSVVRGQTVSIDIRKGTSLADVSGWLKLVEHGIGEQTAAGGTINFQSDSDIVVNSGATLNVTGGLVTYRPGYVATTQLTSNGVVYDIGNATADRIYDGVITPVAGPRNYQPGYLQGYSAGSVTLNAPALVLRGNLKGGVTPGPLQRSVGATGVPVGGLLVVGYADTKGDLSKLHFAGSVSLNGETTVAIPVPAFDDTNPGAALQLPAALRTTTDIVASTLAQNGFSRLQVYADEGSAGLAKALTLAAGGTLTLSAQGGVEIAGNITAPGGNVTASSPASVKVDSGVAIDVAGRWTNDRANAGPVLDSQGNPVTLIVLKGGSINLTAATGSGLAQVTIGDGVSLDVSGGAWLNAQGKQTAGSGGSIAIGPSVSGTNLPAFQGLSLGSGLVLRGYGIASGGSLQISAPNVLVGASSSDPAILGLAPAWFQQGGFASFDVRAGANLTVDTGATIAPHTDNWIGRRSTPTTASGRMSDAFDIATLPLGSAAGSRKAASLSLRAAREDTSGQGVLEVKPGAILATDPGGSVTLAAGSLLDVNGVIAAPGGKINLFLTPDSGAPALAERSIWLGASSILDASAGAASLSSDTRARVQQSLGENWPSLLWTDSRGVTQGSLLDGGQISIGRSGSAQLDAASGYVLVRPGAELDVSGTTATMTISSGRGGMSTSSIASNGGSIGIRAREGLLFEGTLAGAGGNNSARGGSLSLVLDREDISSAAYPVADLVVASREPATGVTPAGLAPGQAINGLAGQGFVTAAAVDAGGFDTVRLKSAGAIDFDLAGGSLALGARSGLRIDAPTIASRNAAAGSTVSLNAPYVAVGNSDWRYQSAARAASAGAAALVVNAGTVDLIGQSTLNGFGSAQFVVSGDTRLVGQVAFDLTQTVADAPPPIHALGSFTVAGTMNFSSAQVYPTSLSEFTLAATGAGSAITFTANGNADGIPLSAAGTLKVQAQDIVQNGIVRAPLGTIDFEAGNSLSYGPGSLTSVAGATTVPLGFVQNGRDWLYDFGNGHTVNLSDPTASNYLPLPDKAILSRGTDVRVNQGATLDLSGGGDLYAYEFTPGPGGSKDVLAQANTYAVLPGFAGPVAPSDFQYGQAGLNPGDKVYLSGIAGLAAGFYTLLPAHYALLPGAFAISAIAGSKNMSATQNFQTTLGAWQVAGYRASLGGGADNLWQGFLLTPATLVRQESEFADHTANAFLASAGITLPRDGGHVVFDVGQSLALKGLVRLDAAAGGQRGIADISAPAIAVVSDLAQALPVEADSSAVTLVAADLNALGADSLLLGGVRTQNSGGQTITVGTGQVIVANDSSHALTGPEILLVAGSRETLVPDPANPGKQMASAAAGTAGQGLVLVKAGSSIAATGSLTHAPQPITLANKSNPDSLGADGALLRVSNGGPVALNRNFVRPDGTVITPAGVSGTLNVEAGAGISANGSVMFDATRTTRIGATPTLGSTAALQLGADRISLGSSAPSTVAGLRFDDAALASLSSLSALTLTSYSSIDVYGSVNLGNGGLQTLNLKAMGIQAYGTGSDATNFNAVQTIRFDGNGTAGAGPQQTASGGTLAFNAQNIEIGNSSFAVRGFSQTTLKANNDVIAAGQGGAFSADANLTVNSGRITSASGMDASITAGNQLNLVQGSALVGTLAAPQLGGHLAFSGQSINSNATVSALSGRVDFTAANGIDISGGTVSAAGGSEVFGSTTAYAPAGSVTMDGGAGNVVVEAAATLDVSATGAAAGTLSFKAANGSTGQVVLDATLKGGAVAGADGVLPAQGSFALDADRMGTTGFGALNAKLDGAGFTESRRFRLRNDDVTLAAGESMTAHQVMIAADKGNITVAGSINADGSKGGSIELYAAETTAGNGKGNVTVTGGAVLSARANVAATSAAGSTGDGGSIVIGTATADGSQPNATSGDASISVIAGAVIDVSGSGLGQGGTVLLRAPRLSGNNDVAIATLDGSTITGSRSTSIEAYKVYTASTVSANADSATNLQVADSSGGPAGKMYTEANSFIAHQGSILGRFNNAASLALLPGLDVRSAGDLTVSVNEASTTKGNRGWNLDAWRFNGQPGVLTLRAGGNLAINGSISDGFTKSVSTAMPDWALDTNSGANSSWSYRLGGGSDLAAANPLATVASVSAGDVKLSFARTSDSSGTDNPVALVRTGTGFIEMAAGRDILLDTLDLTSGSILGGNFSSVNFVADKLLGAGVYTAGILSSQPPAATPPPTDKDNTAYGSTATTGAKFTQGGGSISVYADRNVIGPVTQQLINNWLFRQGQVTTDSSGNTIFARSLSGRTYSGPVQYTAWWSRFDYFNEGIATFGGGDITVRANTGNVVDLSASAATNGFYTPTNADGRSTSGATRTENGGGDLAITAGGDIRGGAFYVQKGSASLTAQGSITTGNRKVINSSAGLTTPVALRPVLAAGDAQFSLVAGKDLQIEAAFNPGLFIQSSKNVPAVLLNSPSLFTNFTDQLSYFSTYSASSAVRLSSVSGNIVLNENMAALVGAGGTDLSWNQGSSNPRLSLVHPGSLTATALNGDVSFREGFSLWPSPTGELQLLAKGSVTANPANSAGLTQPIVMIDRDPAVLLPAAAPYIPGLTDFYTIQADIRATGIYYHTATGLHTGDTDPVRIVALDGDISFKANNSHSTTLVLPKAAEIIAGRDIVDAGFAIQDLAPTDVTTISAGRDIIDATIPASSNSVSHVLTGPGRIDFSAGRNFDLGNGKGVETRGNLDNPYLPPDGAAINVVAGATPDYSAFAAQITSPANFTASDGAALIAYMHRIAPALPPDMSVDEAWASFNGYPISVRRPFLDTLFFSALQKESGVIGGGALDLAKFDATIASLFPSGSIHGGDVNVFGSQLKTSRGGAINMYASGGSVYAGLVSIPSYLKNKAASDLGIFTIAGGAIQALVETDFLVNQGRVFTLGGGDITVVSQYGNIDAGKGSKTAQAAPPPVLRTDDKGNTQVDISGSISGSGFANLRTSPDVPASNVYVITPRGTFDAGDAGIRSTGSVGIVAQTVLNASNIAAAGGVSGAKTADTSGLGSAAAAPSTTPATKTDSFANASAPDPNAATSLTVELLGYGGADSQENVTQAGQNSRCAKSDDDCKKKQTL